MDDDSDADDDDSFTVTQIAVTGDPTCCKLEVLIIQAVHITGTYGTLSWSWWDLYVCSWSICRWFRCLDTATDSFTYTTWWWYYRHCNINFTVTGINDLPTASNNTITTNEDTNHVFSTSDFNLVMLMIAVV